MLVFIVGALFGVFMGVFLMCLMVAARSKD